MTKPHPNTLANLTPRHRPRHDHQLAQFQREPQMLGEPGMTLATSADWHSFINILQKHKLLNKISYVDMALDCGESPNSFYHWINYGRSPRLRTICSVFENLGYELVLRRKP